ncbi:MAG TPA: DUF6263 family protein [Bacteroidales bacterium]|nr:DUF6263 family protein [Bacteroidales bacterium]
MKKIFLLSLSMLVCISAISQNSVNLKLNLEKNKIYRLSAVSEQTIQQTINGNQQTIESKNSYTASLKMADATAAFMVVEFRFDSISARTNTMGKTTIMSSAGAGDIKSKETSDIMSSVMNKMTKNPFYAKMDFTGNVIDIINAKMVSDMILKDTSSITLAEPLAAAIKTQIGNMISAGNLKTNIEMFTHFLPGKQIGTGESWTIVTPTNSGGMMLEITTVYKLDGISGNKANVSAESSIKAAPYAVPMKSGGATVSYDDLRGLSKSSVVIDTNTGLVSETSGKTHISGNLGISYPGGSMQMPMDINGESKIVLLK